MKLHHLLYTLTALTLSFPAFGEEEESVIVIEEKSYQETTPPATRSQTMQSQEKTTPLAIQTVWGAEGARLASANPNPKGFGLVLSGEYLYWTSYQNNLYLPVASDIINSQSPRPSRASPNSFTLNTYLSENKTFDFAPVCFDFDSGYRIGIGYMGAYYDDWEVFAEYSQLQNKAHRELSYCCPIAPFCLPDELAYLYEEIPVSSENQAPVALEADWRLDFYNLDVSLAESFFLSRHLLFRPYFGCKASWIEQNGSISAQIFTQQNDFISFPDNYAELTFTTEVDSSLCVNDARSTFWGVGPLFGIDSKWFLGKYINLGAEASAALLFGQFRADESIFQTLFTQNSSSFGLIGSNNRNASQCIATNFSYQPFLVVPTARIAVDIGFDYPCREKLFFSARVGYEVNYYWRQNYLDSGLILLQTRGYTPANTQAPGDLSLQGLVAGLSLRF